MRCKPLWLKSSARRLPNDQRRIRPAIDFVHRSIARVPAQAISRTLVAMDTIIQNEGDRAMTTAVNVSERSPLTLTQVVAVSAAAKEAGAYPALVFNRGSVDEVALYWRGELSGTVFRPKDSGGLAVWVAVRDRERR